MHYIKICISKCKWPNCSKLFQLCEAFNFQGMENRHVTYYTQLVSKEVNMANKFQLAEMEKES
jgi:hypothetical protein